MLYNVQHSTVPTQEGIVAGGAKTQALQKYAEYTGLRRKGAAPLPCTCCGVRHVATPPPASRCHHWEHPQTGPQAYPENFITSLHSHNAVMLIQGQRIALMTILVDETKKIQSRTRKRQQNLARLNKWTTNTRGSPQIKDSPAHSRPRSRDSREETHKGTSSQPRTPRRGALMTPLVHFPR